MMKKQHSKSTLPKKSKTTCISDTRKSRATKTQSCIKINSQQTEHSRAVQQNRTNNASQLSRHQNSKYVQYEAVQTT